MSDSDDVGTLRPKSKRRRISSRSALLSNPDFESIEKDAAQSSITTSNGMGELDGMIAELRANLTAKKRGNQHQASAAELEVNRVRSALSEQEHDYGELEASLARKRDEIELTKTELSSLGKVHESSKAATLATGRMLEKATTDIQELENLARELPVRLHLTAFDSKEASIMTMMRSFRQDILQKYFEADGTDPSDAPDLQQREEDPLDQLRGVLRGLRPHKAYKAFAHPVTEDIAPGYFDIIKHPIDLSTIRRKLESGVYTSSSDFVADAKLMFGNCRTYNAAGSPYAKAADDFEQQMQHLMKKRGIEGL